VSIGMFFVAGKLEVFVEIFENDRRSRDCLNIAHRRSGGSIGAIDDFETGSPPAVERPSPGVLIVRDSQYQVPRIYGNTRAEAMWGAGYATAEDRLF